MAFKRFTNRTVKKLHGHVLYTLGGGLSVREKPDGRKYYVYRYRRRLGPHRGNRVELTYAATDKVDIADAYRWAAEQNALTADNIDPQTHRITKRQIAHKAALKTKPFGEIAKQYFEERTDPDRSKCWSTWTAKTMFSVMERIQKHHHAFNTTLVANIEPEDVAEVIDTYGQDTPVMALRFRDFIYGTMELARDLRCYEHPNPADPSGPLRRLLKIKHSSKQHPGWHHKDAPRLYALLLAAEKDCSHDGLWTTAQAAKAIGRERFSVLNVIKRGELPAVKGGGHGKTSTYLVKPADVAKIEGFDIKVPSAEPNFGEGHLAIPMLRLLQLTAARFSEVSYMTWDEIDPDKRLWAIPPERTKSKRKHLVPLTDEAWAIIEKMRARGIDSPYVFARGPTLTGADFHLGKPLTRECVIMHLRRACGDPTITHHSFRRNCRSWIEEQLIYWPVIGRAILGHATSSGLDYIYGGDAEFVTPCRRALNAWADYLKDGRLPAGSQSAEIIPLTERRASNA